MNWEPAHADHSIDNVNALLNFRSPIGANDLDDLIVAARKSAEKHGLINRVDLQEADMPPVFAGGPQVMIQMGSIAMRRRVNFQQVVDGSVVCELSLGASSMVLTTTRYVRWSSFSKMMSEILDALDASCHITGQVSSVRLQFLDRFLSPDGGGDHFEVVSRTSPLVSAALTRTEGAFHSHTGWFEYLPGNIRRLTNVNLDANDLSPPTPPEQTKRALAILSMIQHEAMGGVIQSPVECLNQLHQDLKTLFGSIITEDAAKRISLTN